MPCLAQPQIHQIRIPSSFLSCNQAAYHSALRPSPSSFKHHFEVFNPHWLPPTQTQGSENVDAASAPLFGDMMVVAAQAFAALQFILEEKVGTVPITCSRSCTNDFMM